MAELYEGEDAIREAIDRDRAFLSSAEDSNALRRAVQFSPTDAAL